MPTGPLPADLEVKSKMKLKEKSDRILEDLTYIRQWIARQPHLNVRVDDDRWLLAFLRACKFSLQKVTQKIDLFYTVRNLAPEFFSIRDPTLSQSQEILKFGLILPLKNKEGSAQPLTTLIRTASINPSLVPLADVLKIGFMITDLLMMENDNFAAAGQVLIFDCKGITPNHIIQATPTIMKKMATTMQSAYPTRFKGIYFINMTPMFESVVTVIKHFAKEQIKKRIYVYGEDDLDEFKRHFPDTLLPDEYGGDSGPIQELTDYWTEKIISYRKWFLEDSMYCTNEKLRPDKSYL